MPRLTDLLEYLAAPGNQETWLLLDIKVLANLWDLGSANMLTEEQQIDNDANNIMRLMAKAIEDTSPNPRSPWNRRIVLGCWAVRASCGLRCRRSL